MLFFANFTILAGKWISLSAPILDIVPQQTASKLAKLWVPVLKELERDLGFNLQFSTAENMPTFEK